MKEKSVVTYGEEFLKDMKRGVSRYKSWEYCYNEFMQANKDLKNVDIDKLCLHLFCYLASWGMYRTSTFLIYQDYTVHEKTVRLILFGKDDATSRSKEYAYQKFWGLDVTKWNDEELKNIAKDIENFIQALKKIYDPIRNKVNKLRPEEKQKQNHNAISDILISKILLGTMGCIPAFDTNFKKGIHGEIINGKRLKASLTADSIYRLFQYYKNDAKLEKLRKEFSQMNKCDYPPMKVLDSCFWQKGKPNEK